MYAPLYRGGGCQVYVYFYLIIYIFLDTRPINLQPRTEQYSKNLLLQSYADGTLEIERILAEKDYNDTNQANEASASQQQEQSENTDTCPLMSGNTTINKSSSKDKNLSMKRVHFERTNGSSGAEEECDITTDSEQKQMNADDEREPLAGNSGKNEELGVSQVQPRKCCTIL